MTWRKEATVRETNPDDATAMSAVCDTTEVELHEVESVDGAATYDSSLARISQSHLHAPSRHLVCSESKQCRQLLAHNTTTDSRAEYMFMNTIVQIHQQNCLYSK